MFWGAYTWHGIGVEIALRQSVSSKRQSVQLKNLAYQSYIQESIKLWLG